MTSKTLSWIILVVLALVWGSSFILMKRGLDSFSSDEVAALRISIAFLFLTPLYIKHYKIDLKKYFKGLFIMGVFGNLIPAFLFTKAETQVSSSLAGMLNALTPIFTIIVASVWLKVKPDGVKISGIIVGFVAASCLMLFDKTEDMFRNVIYSLLIFAATFCYAISVNGIKKYLSDLNSVKATLWAFTITGPVALIYLFGFSDFTLHLSTNNEAWTSLGYISILAIVGTALSVILYNVLIKLSGVLFASSCTYLIPVFAIFWGLFDGETVNFIQILSIVAIILSVYLINRGQKFAHK
ncbi:EamA family transporter [Sphingobacteriaceae bacterium]|nr:EamA family transporter [Sphingobacteriaceae bacterium]